MNHPIKRGSVVAVLALIVGLCAAQRSPLALTSAQQSQAPDKPVEQVHQNIQVLEVYSETRLKRKK